jgi:NAD(P)-dependent dehydrogenase (short-subunit alcohol dehydrogenase family)
MRPIQGASILITGGGSGLGAGAAAHFVARGARVTISGRRADKVHAVVERLGPDCAGVVGDVTVDADRRAMIERAVDHGDGRLDALISNAGNMYRGPIEDLEESRLLEIFHTNVVAGMMLTGLAKVHLSASAGAVIFVGSVHTQRAFPGASPYAATKGALETLTGVLAAELGPAGIRVGCVRPGAVFTEINQRAGLGDDETAYQRLMGLSSAHVLGRIGTTTEIAEAFEYLVRAEWTTGAVLTVDGGLGLGVTNA